MNIRFATPDDAKYLLAIYAPYVQNTAISFEYTIPTLEEFRDRISSILKNYPYLVAEEDGKILGYCYASLFHAREAYRHTVETSIYVASAHQKKGLGKALYTELERLLTKQNVYTLYACVTFTEHTDEFLNDNSLQFHTHMGYKQIGCHKNCGYKFGKWYSVLWFEKCLSDVPKYPKDFIPFSKLV